MKQLMTVLACSMALLSISPVANAQKEASDMKKTAASAPMSKQQTKMATCNTKSKGLKGDEHKKFMSECMKAT